MSLPVFENELTLYFYPSPGLDWSTPRALIYTTFRNKLLGKSRSIGHVSVRLRVGKQTAHSKDHFLIGMTQARSEEGRKEVLWDGYGMGILLHAFAGALEKHHDLEPELAKRAETGQLSFLKIGLSKASIERAFEYERLFRASKGASIYGMPFRPRYAEGSGCSAYGASFLEVLGLLNPEFHANWSRNFLIPKNLVGGPYTETMQKVSVLKMLLAAESASWADPSTPHHPGFFWDPDLMHKWCVQTYDSLHQTPGTLQLSRDRWLNAKGILWNCENHTPPSGEILLG